MLKDEICKNLKYFYKLKCLKFDAIPKAVNLIV